ncbi:MAG: metallophosphoesterase family protein [Eubacteriales bacterium]|nr:metallophosphoesterase family protein [Eubacteriales bacterium]
MDKAGSAAGRLPIAETVCFPGMPAATACHGSPRRVNEKMLSDDEKTLAIMGTADTSLILCGHTHVQTKIIHGKKAVLNPGSVGAPLHSQGQAQFLILHGAEGIWQEEWISLTYDVEKAIGELQEAGLDVCAPYWCRVTESLLRNGEISHGTVLAKAMELCREETGSCNWPEIPEKYWKRAVECFYC